MVESPREEGGGEDCFGGELGGDEVIIVVSLRGVKEELKGPAASESDVASKLSILFFNFFVDLSLFCNSDMAVIKSLYTNPERVRSL
jgi:hypothetical protein